MSLDRAPHRPTEAQVRAAKKLKLPCDDRYAQGMLDLAGRAFERKQFVQAQKILKGLAMVRPDDARVYEAYGALYLAQGDFASARICFEEALKIDDASLRARLHLGEMAWRRERDEDRAKRFLMGVLKHDRGAFAERARAALSAIK